MTAFSAIGDGSRLLQLAAVVGPVQQGLALLAAASEVAFAAVLLDLGNVPAHGLPTIYGPLLAYKGYGVDCHRLSSFAPRKKRHFRGAKGDIRGL